jgi:hypothetical protein
MRRNFRVEALAEELARVRQRGVDQLQRATSGRPPVATPILDALARRHAGRHPGPRVPLIRKLFADTLTAWPAEGGTTEAPFIRSLYFPAEERPARTEDHPSAPEAHPSAASDQIETTREKHSPSALLEAARKRSGYPAGKEFDDYRRRMLTAYAAYLLTYMRREQARRIWRRIWPIAAVMVVALLVSAAVITVRHFAGSAQHAVTATATFTFDALGGGSSVIRVFPGVRDIPADLLPNGTFFSGQTAPAICQTRGRLARSDPSVGERPQ